MKENKITIISGVFLLVIIITVITCNRGEEASFPANVPEAVVEEVKEVVETKAEEVKAKVIEMLPAVKELPIALPKVIEEAVAPVELPVEEAPADSTTTEPTTNEGDE
tara:strand:- start:172 stop:495 length:324 start_codon:yes stop_codon:yes gene_type:complete